MNSTKKAIFHSAIKEFSVNGYNGATMDEIAQSAGVAKGTLYYHFKSKEEIFNFIIREGLKVMKDDTINRIERVESDVERLRLFCLTQLNLANEHRDFIKVVISQLWGENARHLELRREMLEYARGIEVYVKMAIEKRLVKDDNTFLLSCSILGTVCSLAIHELIKNDNIAKLVRDNEWKDRMEAGIAGKENIGTGIKEAAITKDERMEAGGSGDHIYDVDKLLEYLLYGIGAVRQ